MSDWRTTAFGMPAFGHVVGNAHLWFAWHPVRTWDGRWVWLKDVVRRLVQAKSHLYQGGSYQWFQYALQDAALEEEGDDRKDLG